MHEHKLLHINWAINWVPATNSWDCPARFISFDSQEATAERISSFIHSFVHPTRICNKVIETEFRYHAIRPFKGVRLNNCSYIHTGVEPSPQSILGHFISPQRSFLLISILSPILPTSCPQPQATTKLLYISTELSIWGISCKQTFRSTANCDWLLSLTVLCSRSLHSTAGISTSGPFIMKSRSAVVISHPLLIPVQRDHTGHKMSDVRRSPYRPSLMAAAPPTLPLKEPPHCMMSGIFKLPLAHSRSGTFQINQLKQHTIQSTYTLGRSANKHHLYRGRLLQSATLET